MKRVAFVLFLGFLLSAGYLAQPPAQAQSGTAVPRVNIPYTSESEGNIPTSERAIFWFGEVGPTLSNNTDVRIIYNEDKVHITLHVIDRYIWYDTTPSEPELTEWDAATLFLNLSGNAGNQPTADAHKFVVAFHYPTDSPREPYQAVYRGNGSGWETADTPFTWEDAREGEGLNDLQDDKGWNVTYRIPYTSLGLSGPPAEGTTWGLAVIVHDRDDAPDTPIPDLLWPETLNPTAPSSWGQMVFGLPQYTPPIAEPSELITIKHGVNGAIVPDGHVGGATNCAGQNPPFWPTWGNLNYAGDPNANIQNQWNLGDWACFSKYFVTFPLDSLPADQTVITATLTMYHFGNSLPDKAQPSWIQVFTVEEDWDEATLTWNNAPRAIENIARAYVEPLPGGTNVNIPIHWDISQAVAEAYAAGEPLRLALYSADGGRHSGKYFRSSDANQPVRPTLTVQMGNADGFILTADSPLQTAEPGGSATIHLHLEGTGNFSGPVNLLVQNPDPTHLDVDPMNTTVNNLPGQVVLTLTDLHPPSFTDSVMYVVPVTATGGDIEHTITVYLLVNGSQVFLPVIQR